MTVSEAERETEQASPRRWLVLFAMTGSLAMILLDVTVVGVALPRIRTDLSLAASSWDAGVWVMNGYTLALASLVALGGRVADSFGRVRSFVVGVTLFAIASALCGLATDGVTLVAARVLQGVAAAIMQPASSTLVISSFAPGERGKAMGIYVGIPMLFLALGPVIGGLLTEYVSWRACFYINLPVAAAALYLTMRAKPDNGPRAPRGFDPFGAAIYLLGLPAFVFALQQSGAWGWSHPLVRWPLIGGAICLVVFMLTEWRRERPLVAVRLFEDRGFLGNALVLFLMQFAMTGQVIYMSGWLQAGLGFTPSRAGAALMPMLIPVLVVVQIAGRMYDKVGVRRPVLLGTTLATIGLAIEALSIPTGTYLLVAAGMAVFGTGIGFTMSPTNTDALSRVGGERRGQASGLLGTMRQVGASLGIALVGAAVAAAQSRAIRPWMPDDPDTARVVTEAVRGDATQMDSLLATPDLHAHAQFALAQGTATGQWVACVSIALALLAALAFVRSPARPATMAAETPA
ncbi:MAG: DHA2 family efflux MFS transporter permease subunit [Phycisphaerae bacterium]|nr:DHA2 family efflux MFS transporter permease subunit [Phycisphaerae bacterium]